MRQLTDNWLTSYLQYTELLESPELFHLWTGISVLAATLGRDVWLDRGFYRIYPNHYVILVAATAMCRKSTAITVGRDLLMEAKIVPISAERVTNAALYQWLDRLAKEQGASELLIFADELRTLLSKEEANQGLITTLMRLYTCPEYLENRTKTAGVDHLVNVCLNVLAATTLADFREIIPGVAAGSGFVPRLHIVYQEIPRPRRLELWQDVELKGALINDLIYIRKTIQGPYILSKGAWAWWKDWYERKFELPADESLDGFYGRKHEYVAKLAMVIAAGERDQRVLEQIDFERALRFLNQIEAFMSNVYSSVDVLEDLKYADRVYRQILRKGARGKVVARADLMKANWNKINGEGLTKICDYLAENNKIEILPSPYGRGSVYKLKGGKKSD